MNPKLQKLYKAISELKGEEALKAIGLIFNEKGYRNMLGYYTADTINCTSDEKLSPDDAQLIKDYMSKIKLAKQLVAKNQNMKNRVLTSGC